MPLMIRMLPALALTVAATLLGTLALPASPASAQPAGSGYAGWTLAGSGGAFTGTMSLPASFPTATYTSDSRAPAQVVGGASNWLPAATPFGAVYGSSQNQPYLNLRPAVDAAGAPSTTTYRFGSPTPAAGWGFALGDIDADRVEVSATDQAGDPVPAAGLGFQAAFNYCDAAPRPSSPCGGGPASGDPGFDIPGVDIQASSVTLVGNGPDTGGASGWFQPTVPLSTLTFVFTFQSGFPVYHTWFAALTRSISGSVIAEGVPAPDAELAVLDPIGDPIDTTTTDDHGDYRLDGLGPADGYTVVVTAPDGYQPVGPAQRTVDLTAGDVTGVDFTLTATAPGTAAELPRTGAGAGPAPLIVAGGVLVLSGGVALAVTRRVPGRPGPARPPWSGGARPRRDAA